MKHLVRWINKIDETRIRQLIEVKRDDVMCSPKPTAGLVMSRQQRRKNICYPWQIGLSSRWAYDGLCRTTTRIKSNSRRYTKGSFRYQGCKNRYVKSKLRLRSKKQAEDIVRIFSDLADYSSKEDIQNSYGYAEISDSERERLMNLWDEREQHMRNGKTYSDRVVEMLDKAASRIVDDYEDFLYDADMIARENERNQQGRFPKFE